MTSSGPINTRLAYRCTAAVWLYVPGMSNSSSLKVFPHDAQFKRSRNLPCIRQDHRSCQELSQKNNLRTHVRVGFDSSVDRIVALGLRIRISYEAQFFSGLISPGRRHVLDNIMSFNTYS